MFSNAIRLATESAAVMRRAALESLAFKPMFETDRNWYFDETFRQSEDIECWLRLALTTSWEIEGVEGALTKYRVNGKGLSANTDRQLASWERMVAKLSAISPDFFHRHGAAARAYQLRYLSRRAVSDLQRDAAWTLMRSAMATSRVPLREEPLKTLTTLAAAGVLKAIGDKPITAARAALKAQRGAKANV